MRKEGNKTIVEKRENETIVEYRKKEEKGDWNVLLIFSETSQEQDREEVAGIKKMMEALLLEKLDQREQNIHSEDPEGGLV